MKPLVALAMALSVLVSTPALVSAAAAAPSLQAPAAILMDASSGRVLYEKDADTPRPPASMTKLMTLHLALRAIAEGKARPSDLVAVSEKAYRTEGAQIWLEPGEQMPLGTLLMSIAVGSANDASVAVAEHIGGTEDAFVAGMNREARRLGMTHTHFVNAHGLDDPKHVTTPRDLALLARAAVADPGMLKLTSLREDRSIRDGKGGKLWLINHNRLLGKVIGLDGLKTGYTSRAGFCLTGSAKRQGMRLISVVMGDATSKARYEDTAALLNWGFASYEALPLRAPAKGGWSVAVRGGQKAKVQAVPAGGASSITVERGSAARIKTAVSLPAQVNAPVRRGARLGSVQISLDGKSLGRVPLVAQAAVPKATLFGNFLRIMQGIVASL